MDRRRPVPPQQEGDRRRPPPAQSWHLRPWKCPYPTFPFENLVIVSPQDFQYDAKSPYFAVILNDRFVFTAVFENYFPQEDFTRNPCPPGSIALSERQRTWTRISITDTVKVDLYDPQREGGAAVLATMDISVRFHTKTSEIQVDETDLNMRFMKRNINQYLAEGQQLLLDYNSVVLRLTVNKVLTLAAGNNARPESRTRGLVTKDTQVAFMTEGTPPVNFKPSSKQSRSNLIIQPNFKFEELGIGGLDNEFSTVFRRAFASRIFPRGEVEKMGITHVKGLLLHGPPGTGKTLIARQIGKMLNAKEPKIVNGPEVLNKFVGQSEENIRKLFEDAEKEYKAKGPDSQLHIIIFDELDAVCRQRGTGSAGGTGVGDNIVNQLLTKLDGVEQVSNFLLIGMTNRLDLIDEALLRPGRLEVHVEISLPDEQGRVQILNIHTAKMRENHMLADDVNIEELAGLTKNFSGAELAGLAKSASSFAMSRHVEAGTLAKVKDDLSDLQIYRQDFIEGLGEIKPVFGTSESEVGRYIEGGILNFSQSVDKILEEVAADIKGLKQGSASVFKVLFHGLPGAGKTALAAKAALDSEYPFVRTLAPQEVLGLGELAKVQQINKVFSDAYKSMLSVIIIDSIEDIVEWTDIGMRFSNAIRLAIRAKMAQSPPPGHKVLVLVTTSELNTMKNLGLLQLFDKMIGVPYLNGYDQLRRALKLADAFGSDQDRERAIHGIRHLAEDKPFTLGVKNVLKKLAISSGTEEPVERFATMIGEEIAYGNEF